MPSLPLYNDFHWDNPAIPHKGQLLNLTNEDERRRILQAISTETPAQEVRFPNGRVFNRPRRVVYDKFLIFDLYEEGVHHPMHNCHGRKILRSMVYGPDRHGDYPVGIKFNDDGRGNAEFVDDGENILVIDQDIKNNVLKKAPLNTLLIQNPDLQRTFSNKLKTRILKDDDEFGNSTYGDEEYDEHRKLEVRSRLSDHPDKNNYDFDAFLLMHPDYVVTPDNDDELNGK